MPSLNHYYKISHYPLQVGTRSFEGISPLWPPWPGKAIKLFFSTSPKILSPRFNLASGYRGWIQLQRLVWMDAKDQNLCVWLTTWEGALWVLLMVSLLCL